MDKHPVYGLLYIILLPFSLFIGISALSLLLGALQAPVLLLPAFLLACFTIYTFVTLIFYVNTVQKQKELTLQLRDWIRVNAFVILIPTLVVLLESIAVSIQPSLISLAMKKIRTQQNLPYTDAVFTRIIRILFYFLLVYSIALAVHLVYTFRLLKQYKSGPDLQVRQENEMP